MDTHGTALRFNRAGISTLTVALDGTKIPDRPWGDYQDRLPTEAELLEQFGNGHTPGLGVICGRVSGNLEVIDCDEAALLDTWRGLVTEEYPELVERLILIRTPRPGFQLWARCEEPVSGNQKLAIGLRPNAAGEIKKKTLIETRGERGYAVAPGSPVEVHENRTPYQVIRGVPWDPPVITAAEREVMLRCARSLTEILEPERHVDTSSAPRAAAEGELRPGDDFNARGDFPALLREHNWTEARKVGEAAYWRRPGKAKGWSATLGHVAPDVLRIFSTNADPFEDGRTYDLFGAYAVLKHKGDFAAATKDLAAQGYGTPLPKREDPPPPGDDDDPQRGAGTPAPAGDEETDSVPARRPGGAVLVRLSDVKAERVRWLWPGRLPRGKLAILDGDPGLGKSTMALDIAARVTLGAPMPDGAIPDLEGPSGVVILTAEDGLGDTVRPRLEACGADLERIVALTAVEKLSRSGEDRPLMEAPDLRDLAAIEAAILDVEAALVIIDPIMSYLPDDVNSGRDHEIRRVLAPLAALAERRNVTVLVVRHLNKSNGSSAVYRGGGSIGIIGAARVGLLVAKDPDDPTEERRVLAVVKCNLAAPVPALAFTIQPYEDTSIIDWGDVSQHTATSLLAQPERDEEKGAVVDARQFLRNLLDDGPVSVQAVRAEAKAAGLAWRTVERAKSVEGVTAQKIGFGDKGEWQWKLTVPSTELSPPTKTGIEETDCPDQAQNGVTKRPNTANTVNSPYVYRDGGLNSVGWLEQPTELSPPTHEGIDDLPEDASRHESADSGATNQPNYATAPYIENVGGLNELGRLVAPESPDEETEVPPSSIDWPDVPIGALIDAARGYGAVLTPSMSGLLVQNRELLPPELAREVSRRQAMIVLYLNDEADR